MSITRNSTRSVQIGNICVGNGNPIAVQSMTATKTQNVAATIAQAEALRQRGAGVVRIAVDSEKDAAALAEIRKGTTANLAVDLQENFRLADLGRAARGQDSLQPRSPVPPSARQTLAGQSAIHHRPGRGT